MSKTSIVLIAILVFIGVCIWDHNVKKDEEQAYNQATLTMVSQCQADVAIPVNGVAGNKWVCQNLEETRKAERLASEAEDQVDSLYWLVFIMWMWM